MDIQAAPGDLSIAIMAGGKSTRMGSDKALIPFRGKPMITHVIEQVRDLSSRIVIVTNEQSPYKQFGFPLISDVFQDMGPLGGIHAVLYRASTNYVLIVACDMPGLNRALLEHMIALRNEADIVVPRWTKFPEPLHAVYSRSCLSPIDDSLKSGIRKVIGFYGKVAVRYVDRQEIKRFDPLGRSFANINTPNDIEEAESW